jgi:hypothetical protein
MPLIRLLIVLALACSASGCYVASLAGLADASSSVMDEALLGHWRNADEGVELVVARSQWHSYDVTLRERGTEQRFTARVTTLGGAQYFDATVHSGTDAGVGLVPVHVLGRTSVRDAALVVELLDPDWFTGRMARGSLTTAALIDDRETVLLTAPRAQLRRWLAAHATSPAMFTEWATLTREIGSAR